MPGEDETEWDKMEEGYDKDEYIDEFGDEESQDVDMDYDEEGYGEPGSDYDAEKHADDSEVWQ